MTKFKLLIMNIMKLNTHYFYGYLVSILKRLKEIFNSGFKFVLCLGLEGREQQYSDKCNPDLNLHFIFGVATEWFELPVQLKHPVDVAPGCLKGKRQRENASS